MNFVNSSLLNTNGVLSNQASETVPAGQNGDLNQEFSQMLQFLRQAQDSKTEVGSNQDVFKDNLPKEHSLPFKAPMKNLLGFLEAFEGQLAKDSDDKSNDPNNNLEKASAEGNLTALSQILSILQENLIGGPENRVEKLFSRADFDVGNLDLDELADLLKEVKSIFDQVTKHSQLQLPRYEIKTLPLINSALDVSEDEASIVAPDTSILHGGDEGTRTVVSETTVDEEPEVNSHNLRATNLSMALSKLSAFVSKFNKEPNEANGGVLVSNQATSKVTYILDMLKGMNLYKFFPNSDESSLTADNSLYGSNQPSIQDLKDILNKVKSEGDSLSTTKKDGVTQVSNTIKTLFDGSATLVLPMRTSDVVFASQTDFLSVPISNFPKSLRETPLPLERLTTGNSAVDLMSKEVVVTDVNSITPATTKADVTTKHIEDFIGKSNPKTDRELDQALINGKVELLIKPDIKTINTDVASLSEITENPHDMSLEQMASKSIKKVVEKPVPQTAKTWTEKVRSDPVERVTTKPIDQVASDPVEPVTTKPIDEVTTHPVERVATKPMDQVVAKPVEQGVTKLVEPAVIKSAEKVATRPAERVAPEFFEDLETQEIKPLSNFTQNAARSFIVPDASLIKVEPKTAKSSLEQIAQLNSEPEILNVKISPKPTSTVNINESPDGVMEGAELAGTRKVEKTDYLQVGKGDRIAQPKTLQNDIAIKEAYGGPEAKWSKGIVHVSEFSGEATGKNLESAERPQKIDTVKVDARLSSYQDNRIRDDVLKDNRNFEEGFSKMAQKVAASKQAVQGQKAQHTQVAGTFNIEPPKIRHHSRSQNISVAATPVADLVARTTQAFVVQQQGFARKKSVGDVSVISSAVGVNVDATAGHQITASSSSQSQTGQGSSSSNILEKWADSHLDLSSKGWSTNMAKSMVSALNSGRERLMFSLSPPSLGRISIAFASTRGALDVRIQAERKATIALLGDAEGKLTSNLESAGHRVNSLSYAEMNSGEAKFHFDHNQSSNNENKGKDESDSPQMEKSVELEAGGENSMAKIKKADDSLVNITV